MTVREFDGIDDAIDCAIGGISGMTHGTSACIFKTADITTDPQPLAHMYDSGDSFASSPLFIDITSGRVSVYYSGSSAGPIVSTGIWYLAVARKASGTATPRFSLYNFNTSTWSHQNGASSLANGTAPGAGGNIKFRFSTSEYFDGRVAVRALWSNSLPWSADTTGDAAIESAGLHTSLLNWSSASPTALWPFNQSSTSIAVEDTAGAADQTAITGTTVITTDDPPGFTFGSTIVTPNVLDTTVTVLAPTVQLSSQFITVPLVEEVSNLIEPELHFVFSLPAVSGGSTLLAPTVSLTSQTTIQLDTVVTASTLLAPTLKHQVFVVRSVAQGSDDGFESAAGSPDLDDTHHVLASVGQTLGLRFEDIQVPNNAELASATISVTLTDTSKNDAEGTWFGQDADDTSTFTTTDGDIDGRTKTTASAAWTTNDVGTAGNVAATPSLVDLVAEIIARGGWALGNSMAFFYVHDSSSDVLQFAAFENETEEPAFLTISYLVVDSQTVFLGVLSASAAVLSPTIGALVTPDVVSALATVLAPTVILFDQIVQVSLVSTQSEVFAPVVASSLQFLPGFEVTFNELNTATVVTSAKEATVRQPDMAATVAEPAFALTFSEDE
jgi:hypothetical protein